MYSNYNPPWFSLAFEPSVPGSTADSRREEGSTVATGVFCWDDDIFGVLAACWLPDDA